MEISAYKSTLFIIEPYTGELDSSERQFNIRLSRIRIGIEQYFRLAKSNWSLNRWKMGLKANLMPVASFLKVAILLANCLTCFRSYTSVNSRYEAIDIPTIEEYLAAMAMRSQMSISRATTYSTLK